MCFQQLNAKLKDEGEKRTERTKKRLHQRFSLFIPEEVEKEEEELNATEEKDSDEEEGDEYTLDDIFDADASSCQGGKDADGISISSFSVRKTLPSADLHPPLPRTQSSQQMRLARETSFHRRQISAPAEMPPKDQVTRDSIIVNKDFKF